MLTHTFTLKIKYEKRINLDFHLGIKRGLVASNCETIVRLFRFGLGLGRFLTALASSITLDSRPGRRDACAVCSQRLRGEIYSLREERNKLSQA